MNPTTHVVSSGETLSGIAAKYGVTYQDIAKANGIANPNLIYPGQKFNIPNAQAGTAPAPQVAQPTVPTAQPVTQSAQPSNPGGGDTELQQLAKTDRNPVQETRYQELLKTQGSSSGGTGLPQAPTFDLVAATEKAYNTPEIQAANTAITQRQQALAEAQNAINDNPFYSEATRVGKLAKLQEKANADITVQQNQLAMLKADAAIKLGAEQGQYNINHQQYQDNLTNFNNLVSQGGLDNASAADIAKLAVQTGIPTSMIQSIQALSVKKNNPVDKPQIVTSTDNAGNLSILAVDSNGTIINQTTVAGAGKADKGPAGAKVGSSEYNAEALAKITPAIVATLNSYGNISPTDWKKAEAAWLGQGLSRDDFVKNFGQYADVNRGDFQSAYGFKNPND